MSDTELKTSRPLSPHWQIYKPMLSMMVSFSHRLTGGALYFGAALLAWWLISAATGPAYFDMVDGFFGSFFGRVILLGYTWALIHHMIGGLRHFLWDTGRGLELDTIEFLAKASVAASVSLTLLVWIVGYIVR